MKTLIDTKYIKIIIDLKSWVLPIGIDWRKTKYTRQYYAALLCFHFEMGIDPYKKE